MLGEHGDDAKLLAGGHSLLPLMKLRLATPAILVDIGGSATCPSCGRMATPCASGPSPATTTGRPTCSRPGAAAGLVAGQIGDPQVRHRGTIGGSIAHGDPASDLPAALLALRATLVVQGPGGGGPSRPTTSSPASSRRRWLPTRCSPRSDAGRAGGRAGRSRSSTRRAQDWAIVGVAAVLRTAPARVALVNMASVPLRALASSRAALGLPAADAAGAGRRGHRAARRPRASPERAPPPGHGYSRRLEAGA